MLFFIHADVAAPYTYVLRGPVSVYCFNRGGESVARIRSAPFIAYNMHAAPYAVWQRSYIHRYRYGVDKS